MEIVRKMGKKFELDAFLKKFMKDNRKTLDILSSQ